MSSSGTPATCRAHRADRWQVIAALVCVSMLGAASAEAQSPEVSRTENRQQQRAFTDVNPCNAHAISGQGNEHTQVKTKSGATTEVTLDTHLNGQAVADNDPTERYQYQDWFTDSFRSSSANVSFTTVIRKHIVREGKPRGQLKGSYFVWEEFTFQTADPQNTFEQKRLQCK